MKPKMGDCAALSCALACSLEEIYGIRTNVVLGDLKIDGKYVFQAKKIYL